MQCHNLRDPAIATASSPNFKQSFGFPLNTNQTQVLQSITAIDNYLLWISLDPFYVPGIPFSGYNYPALHFNLQTGV